MKILIFVIPFILLNSSWSQNQLPSQTEIAKYGALRYFKRLPVEGWDRLLHLAKMGSFDLIYHEHLDKTKKSPFRIFNATKNRRLPNKYWTLGLLNSSYEYSDILRSTEFGVCAGLTMTSRKMQMLAFFDPNNSSHQNIPDKQNNPQAWFEFMKVKIDDVMTHNKMTIFPNFTNIQELTHDPLLRKYFKQHVIRQWELVNINFLQGLFQGYGGTLKEDPSKNIFENLKQIEKTLSLNVNPVVFLTVYNQKIFDIHARWIHVVQVVAASKLRNGSTVLDIWDPNLNDPSQSSKITITSNGKVDFAGMPLSGVIPLKWDNYEIADMVVKNLDFCTKRPGFCTTVPQATPTPAPTFQNPLPPFPQPSAMPTVPPIPNGFQSRRI